MVRGVELYSQYHGTYFTRCGPVTVCVKTFRDFSLPHTVSVAPVSDVQVATTMLPINSAPRANLLGDAVEVEPAVNFEWRGVNAKVGDGPNKDLKPILINSSGDAKPGEILAVMGPSGAGKTSLLNILAARPALGKRGQWSGSITMNGRPLPKAWKRSCAYSMQADIFFSSLTVYDHLRCTALLRLPASWSITQKMNEMHRIVGLLRLDKKLHTVVGSPTERGLSGGELKRLNIATELLSRPKLFFLDEPFTGLDSSLAMTVLSALRAIAATDQTTIVVTVHQPSSPMWAALDKLLLIAPGGRTAYFGEARAAEAHFTTLNMPLPSGWSRPDHFIEIVTAESTRAAAVDAWAARSPFPPPPMGEVIRTRPQPAFCLALRALLPRSIKMVGHLVTKPLEWGLNLAIAGAIGLLWWGVGLRRDEIASQQDYISLIFFFVANFSWAPMFQVLGNFPDERDVLTRERASDSYSMLSWYCAKTIADLPFFWIIPFGFFCVICPMTRMSLECILPLFAVVLLTCQVASSAGALITSAVFDRARATTIAIVYMFFVMCSGGYFVNLHRMPAWVASFRFVSFWYYMLGLAVTVALPTEEDRKDYVSNATLSKYSFSEWSWHGYMEYDIAVMVGFAVVQRILTYFVLVNSSALKFS